MLPAPLPLLESLIRTNEARLLLFVSTFTRNRKVQVHNLSMIDGSEFSIPSKLCVTFALSFFVVFVARAWMGTPTYLDP